MCFFAQVTLIEPIVQQINDKLDHNPILRRTSANKYEKYEIPFKNQQQAIELQEPNFEKIYELEHIGGHLQPVHDTYYSIAMTISSTLSAVPISILIILGYLSLRYCEKKNKK